MAELLYFAKDGSYGCAKDLTILSTEHWSEAEHEAVRDAADYHRWAAAQYAHASAVQRALLATVTRKG
jgi:hypothetical protein